MNILDDLLASLPQDGALVRNVLVGAHWTVVCSGTSPTGGRHCGLASTITGDPQDGSSRKPHGHEQVRDVGRLRLKSARELAEYALSDNLLEASIGVAAINSLLEVDEHQAVEINAAKVLAERGRGKKVALVGHFPFIPKLREQVGQLWVIEQHPTEGEHPAEAAADLIPLADVVALTGTAIINHTLEGLLALCRPDALVMVLGPSTPLSPALFEHGATIISGARVIDPAAVLDTVSQGATFQQVQGVRLLTLQKKKRVLFLCTGNSCRSQMAEAIVNARLGDEWQAFSAGTKPAGYVHPLALRALAEMEITHVGRSKPADEFRAVSFDLVVTVCDSAAEECPIWLGQGKRVHLGFPDPAKATGTEEEILVAFRAVRDDIALRAPELLARHA